MSVRIATIYCFRQQHMLIQTLHTKKSYESPLLLRRLDKAPFTRADRIQLLAEIIYRT